MDFSGPLVHLICLVQAFEKYSSLGGRLCTGVRGAGTSVVNEPRLKGGNHWWCGSCDPVEMRTISSILDLAIDKYH